MSTLDVNEQLDHQLPDIDWTTPPPGVHRGSFAASSGRLATWSMGDPQHPRVVLVPGVTGSKEDFWFVIPVLAEAGFYVQSYDLAGQHDSAAAGPENLVPPRARYDYDLFVDDLVAFIERGAVQDAALDAGAGGRTPPVHLLGYSFAGIVTEIVLARRPDLVASLTLLSTPPLHGQVFGRVRIIGWLSEFMNGKAVATLVKWGVVKNFQRVPAGRLAFVTDRFETTRESSRGQIMSIMMRAPDCEAALRAATVPIALAVGDHDLWPLRLHREFARRIGATIAVYRTGHSPCEATPHQLSRDMLALFAKAQCP